MKHLGMTGLLLLTGLLANACPFCTKENTAAIYNSTFYPNLLTMLSAFIVLSVVVAVLTAIATRRHKARTSSGGHVSLLTPVPMLTTSMILGIGLGGFIDGIVLHQILQWHEMLSHKIPPSTLLAKTVNMFWDGVFHAFCLVVVLLGVVRLWKLFKRPDADKSGKLLAGGMLLGWGLFNIIEGIIDHHLLKLHNVMELAANHNPANFTFLGLSVVMLAAGYGIVHSRDKSVR